MKRFLVLLVSVFLLLGTTRASAGVIDLEDLVLPAESSWNGSDGSGGFTSRGSFFTNHYDATWGSWDGFSYSNRTDTGITDWQYAQYTAIPGMGAGGSDMYAIGYCSSVAPTPPTVTFPEEQVVEGAYFTNTSYAYYSMLNGDMFAKKFEDGDWFSLTITGKDAQGNAIGGVDLALAEGPNILNAWTWMDLSGLGRVKSLEFTLSSSDVGKWGMNTPAYFCMDDLTISSSSAGQGSTHDTGLFPLFLGLFPFGGYTGVPMNIITGTGYLNASPFTLNFNPYPSANYPGTYLLMGSRAGLFAGTLRDIPFGSALSGGYTYTYPQPFVTAPFAGYLGSYLFPGYGNQSWASLPDGYNVSNLFTGNYHLGYGLNPSWVRFALPGYPYPLSSGLILQ